MFMIFKETFALCNLSSLMRRRSSTFLYMMLPTETFYLKAQPFCFMKAGDWFNTSGEDSILTALLSINGYLFFSAFNMGTMRKSNKELHRYGVTGCVLAGHCTDPHNNRTYMPWLVVCVAVKGGRQKLHCQ